MGAKPTCLGLPIACPGERATLGAGTGWRELSSAEVQGLLKAVCMGLLGLHVSSPREPFPRVRLRLGSRDGCVGRGKPMLDRREEPGCITLCYLFPHLSSNHHQYPGGNRRALPSEVPKKPRDGCVSGVVTRGQHAGRSAQRPPTDR